MATDIHAKLTNLGTSAQKARLVVDLVRGKPVLTAVNILQFTPNKAAAPVLKLIKSAMSNAEENFGISREDLYIHTITAEEAPTRKWRSFGARGRFKPMLKRKSHVFVTLREIK